MASLPDPRASFAALERVLDDQPEGVNAEIACGTYLMSPRGRVRHGTTQARLVSALHGHFGQGGPSTPPDWLFVVEPELRAERAFSRLIPDIAGWRSSTTGWPGADESLIEIVPEWVAEVLSPGTESLDRGAKREAYGLMGVGFLWLVDPASRRVETFVNARGRMLPAAAAGPEGSVRAQPFEALDIAPSLFLA